MVNCLQLENYYNMNVCEMNKCRDAATQGKQGVDVHFSKQKNAVNLSKIPNIQRIYLQ